MRRFYFKGVWLWEVAQEDPGWAQRTGELEHDGVLQDYLHAEPRSPNMKREVRCGTVVEKKEGAGGYEAGTSVRNTLHAVEALLIAQADVLGDLSYTEDHARTATVGGSFGSGAQTVLHGAPGGGWTRATGQLVLFLKRSTGAGFVAELTGVPDSTHVQAVLAEAVDVTWELIQVARCIRRCAYMTMDGGGATGQGGREDLRLRVEYLFGGYGAVVVPATSVLTYT